MEPVTIVIICAVVFGVAAGLSFFVRQLLLSRDKNLNDLAQQKALAQEAKELEKLRLQMSSNQRFDSHYQLLGDNRESIEYIDQKIEDILLRKSERIAHYAQLALKESAAIITGDSIVERKAGCDRLKEEINSEIKSYELELAQLQTRRANLWTAHTDLQEYLVEQEKKRNEHLDTVYFEHSAMLEKIYLRHNENSEAMAAKSIEASNQSFKSIFSAPIDFFVSFFKLSRDISPDVAKKEIQSRLAIREMENSINETDESSAPQEDTSHIITQP